MNQITITEVGMRDGLQSVPSIMPTADKIAWLNALYAAGMRHIEVTSFVPAKLMPQLADAAEIVRHAKTLPGLEVAALVPNVKGAQAAMAAGADVITIPCSASAAHSLANVRKTREEIIEVVREVVTIRNGECPNTRIEAGMSTAFGCTIQGEVTDDEVMWLMYEVISAGADCSGLADTTGMANPAQVRRLFERAFKTVGKDKVGAAHMHNTRGLGIANCLAAYDVGVRSFDSSLAGIGGCPHAPGASGNVVTEDLVFMFEAMGVSTGIEINQLMAARVPLKAGIPNEAIYGMIAEAGLPKTFKVAA